MMAAWTNLKGEEEEGVRRDLEKEEEGLGKKIRRTSDRSQSKSRRL